MKAVVLKRFGGPEYLSYEEKEKPIPKADEVLIELHATGINAADYRLMQGKPFPLRLFLGGIFKPKTNVLGADVAGTVSAIGKNVSKFKIGDPVYGDASDCGFGGFAEYATVKEKFLQKKPEALSFELAAAIPMAGLTALLGLKKHGQIKEGERVLIVGASGGVGTFAIQIAKYYGAHVTAVCSTEKSSLAKELGADKVIDYKAEDFTQNQKAYDLILAVNGNTPLKKYSKCLTDKGRYVVTGGSEGQIFEVMLKGPFISRKNGKRFKNILASYDAEYAKILEDLISRKAVIPVIDKIYALSETKVAIEYTQKGHAKGKVIIKIK